MTDKLTPERVAEIFAGPFKFAHDKIWMPSAKGGDTFVLDIRGWGYLTGHGSGALGLPNNTAMALQDAFGQMVADALNALASHASLVAELKAREWHNDVMTAPHSVWIKLYGDKIPMRGDPGQLEQFNVARIEEVGERSYKDRLIGSGYTHWAPITPPSGN
jgi:hypothetical protein